MSRPHEAYATVAKSAADPRDLEASLLLKAANQLQRIKDGWDDAGGKELQPTLLFNRKLWTVFATSVTDDESQLPRDIRQNVANLAIFIFKRTVEIEASPAPEMLDTLININRQIAAGLLQRAS